MMKYILLLMSLILAGCASTPNKKLTAFKPPLSSISGPIKLRQKLSIQSEKENRSFEVVVSKTESDLRVVGLTAMGALLFSMKYDGSKIEVSNPRMKQLAELILSDIFIANMSTADLKKHLPHGYKLNDMETTREISYKNQKFVHVQYNKRSPWTDELTLKRPQQKYSIQIKTLDKL